MKKIIILGTSFILIHSTYCFADLYSYATGNNNSTPPDVISWISKNGDEPISIQNGNNIPLILKIVVSPGGAGINVKNCGTTVHINPGSSAICKTNEAINPVTFSSDQNTQAATGTYTIQLNILGT